MVITRGLHIASTKLKSNPATAAVLSNLLLESGVLGMSLVYGTCGVYALVLQLGAGGQGEVFLGVQHTTRRLFAIKFFDRFKPAAWVAVGREVSALAEVSHPHIVAVEAHGLVHLVQDQGPRAPPLFKPGYASECTRGMRGGCPPLHGGGDVRPPCCGRALVQW